jgi:hypothetical protein
LTTQFTEVAATAIPGGRFRLAAAPDDKDGQTLLFWYPAVTAAEGDYIRAAVKIEAGAKSALDPHIAATVTPYVTADLPDLDLAVRNVTTVLPERTFWDKVIILHGLRQWYDRRQELRHEGQRVSRHYYDIHRLLQAEGAPAWQADHGLAADCATHARLFFGSPDLGLDTAAAGTFTLTPDAAMHDALGRDYAAMSGMIFGDIPTLDTVLASIKALQEAINSVASKPASRKGAPA